MALAMVRSGAHLLKHNPPIRLSFLLYARKICQISLERLFLSRMLDPIQEVGSLMD